MYFLKLETLIWYMDKLKQAPVRRRGFQLVPDFAGTAHAYCGDTLDTCKGDLLEWHKLPTFEMMQRACIIRSRAQSIDRCMLARPYSPALFNQGTLPGPDLLLQRQRGNLTATAVKQRWKAVEEQEANNQSEGGHGTCSCHAAAVQMPRNGWRR